jgi:hypothetical protein
MDIQEFTKQEKKRDMVFYTKVSDLYEGISFLKFVATGKPDLRNYKKFLKTEIIISNIEL